MSRHVAVVLAAGGSRRLGIAKQLLRINGETLVHRAARMALETQPESAIVVLGSYGDRIREAVADLDVRLCVNRDWQRGVASSIDCARSALRPFDGSILVLGCDQPALKADMLCTLLESARNSVSGCSASAYAGTVGSPAVISSARFWGSALYQGDSGFGGMLRGLTQQGLGVIETPGMELDLDTREELALARSMGLIDRRD